jgi:hypothetical protein
MLIIEREVDEEGRCNEELKFGERDGEACSPGGKRCADEEGNNGDMGIGDRIPSKIFITSDSSLSSSVGVLFTMAVLGLGLLDVTGALVTFVLFKILVWVLPELMLELLVMLVFETISLVGSLDCSLLFASLAGGAALSRRDRRRFRVINLVLRVAEAGAVGCGRDCVLKWFKFFKSDNDDEEPLIIGKWVSPLPESDNEREFTNGDGEGETIKDDWLLALADAGAAWDEFVVDVVDTEEAGAECDVFWELVFEEVGSAALHCAQSQYVEEREA